MIIGTNISKSFTGEPVLENIDFKIGNNQKVALVGKNGCGKTTLLKIIAGEYPSDTGDMKMDGEIIGYIEQELTFPKGALVGEYLEKHLENSWDYYKIEMLLKELEFTNFNEYQEISTCSEGQKMKIKVLATLLQEPTLLLIDEPTNHLDIEGIQWFERYVKRLNKSVLMISHDREFLNNTVDEIWEIESHNLIRFVGNYDFYNEEKLKLINKWDEEYVRFLKRKAQLEQLIENVHKIKDGKKRGRAISSAKKRLDREITQNTVEKYDENKMNNVIFETGIMHSKLMVGFDEVDKSYDKVSVFEDLSFEMRGGEKVWLFGPNGAGKSTIVKMVMGLEKPTNGEVKIGNNISIGYFAQKHVELDAEKTLNEVFIEQTGCLYYGAYQNLKKYIFTKDDLKKRICDLSPGQRARFAFAVFAYKDYDMLILDEPDNHLDIGTKEVLEESLSKYEGTLLLISHDRFFVERVGVNKLLNLTEGSLSSL